MTDHLQAIATVLSLVNPFMCVAIFAQTEAGGSPGAKMSNAAKVALAVLSFLWWPGATATPSDLPMPSANPTPPAKLPRLT